jgi:hypothetical protein
MAINPAGIFSEYGPAKYACWQGEGMKKSLRAMIGGLALALCLAGCPQPDAEPDNNEQDSGEKTLLRVQNSTPYTVNVYINDPPVYAQAPGTLRTVSSNNSAMWELQSTAANSNGDTLYFEYLIPVGSTTIPFYANNTDNIKIKKLEAGKINTQDVPPLGNATTNSSFILIRNDSNDTIWLQQGNYTRYPFGADSRGITPGSDAVFVFNDISALGDCTIGALTRRNFPVTSIVAGMVYTFIYDGSGNPTLFLVQPFDPDMSRNIWTIPSKAVDGNYFTMGLLRTKVNVNDGYIIAGKVNYSLDTVYHPEVGAIPYLGMITPTGGMTLEKRVTIRTNPAGINFREFIDNSGGNELVFAGQAYYETADGIPFLLSTDVNGEVNYYYEGFVDDIDPGYQYLYGQKLTPYGSSGYAVGCNLWDASIQKYRLCIYKVSKLSWNTVEHSLFWNSPVEHYVTFWNMVYDTGQNMFIVAAEDFTTNNGYDLNSRLYFVDAVTGTEKFPSISLPRYGVGHFFTKGNDFYIAATYESDSKQRGNIEKLNLSTGILDGSPHLIDSRFVNGAASIEGFVLENDGTIVIGGYCTRDSGDDYTKVLPWLVKYDLANRTKIWEEVYEDFEGYYVYSIHHNAIGSYLMELHNSETRQSYLVSADLFGKSKDAEGRIMNELDPIPRNFAYSASRPGEPGIGITITPLPPDAALSSPVVMTVMKGQIATVSVSGTWESCQWYINGSPATGPGPSFSFTTAAREAGIYTVTVIVTGSTGEKWSAGCRVVVTN